MLDVTAFKVWEKLKLGLEKWENCWKLRGSGKAVNVIM